MRITVSGNPETQTIIVIASEGGEVKYAEEHSPDATLKSVIDDVRKFVGEKSIAWKETHTGGHDSTMGLKNVVP